MWNTLEVTHEGTRDVNCARRHALRQAYKLFRMKQEETIADVQKQSRNTSGNHTTNHISYFLILKQFDIITRIGKVPSPMQDF